MGHDHPPAARGHTDRRWLTCALLLVLAFMVAEIVAGSLAHSLALLADAGHMLTDAAALGLAVLASRIAERPARGAYTYGFARVDALSGQANGITLVLLAAWFVFEGVRRLLDPAPVVGGTVAVVALIGVLVNVLATAATGRADRRGLNVRGVLAHLSSDVWAFAATFAAGIVVVTTGWRRADAVAAFVVAALMAWTGTKLVREAGRVFLEAAPTGVDPADVRETLAGTEGVADLHDLHVWMLGVGETALSAHVLVDPEHDCHEVAARLRTVLQARHDIGHVTLQTDHAEAPTHDVRECADAHAGVPQP